MSSAILRELSRLKKQASTFTRDLSLLEGIIQESGAPPKTPDEKKVIHIDEMAIIMGVSTRTVHRWIKDDKLQPMYRRGRVIYWLRSELDEVLRNAESEKK